THPIQQRQFVPHYLLQGWSNDQIIDYLINQNPFAKSDLIAGDGGTGQFSNGVNRLIGNQVWVNEITHYDTTWAPSSANVHIANRSYYTDGNLWVYSPNGMRGRLTLSSRKNSYILGNIFYRGTPMGTAPDGWVTGNDYSGPVNPYDMFGLVSESSIIIKYKWQHPEDTSNFPVWRATPRGTFYMYGAYSAQGGAKVELGAWGFKSEGVFTFEYQHPKGSHLPFTGYRFKRDPTDNTKAIPIDYEDIYDNDGNFLVRIPDVEYMDYIDLHMFKYPPDAPSGSNTYVYSWQRWPGHTDGSNTQGTTGGPGPGYQPNRPGDQGWYSCLDYPWHNPQYPASIDVSESTMGIRGNVVIYGSIASRRRGFLRRTANIANDNPDVAQWWDLGKYDIKGPPFYPNAHYVFGGPPPTNRNKGYTRDYYFDRRFYWDAPPDYPEVYTGAGANRMTSFEETTWNYKKPPANWIFPQYY
ncbi:MAG: hypothetical protein FWG20_05830, partial [Candidatus Cloacimonetes bacterium]|nr:hypothetical protein [Candidatus Cloacimonadota bacterium]